MSVAPCYAGSFNFNKLRAFLFSRALAGVGLDSDQWVAPGVDRLFDMTEREIHEKYPFPIMPVHFLDRGPKDRDPASRSIP